MIDIILVAILLWVLFRILNSRKGVRFLGVIALLLILLVVTAFIRLPGAHLTVQFLVILSVVALPVLFRPEFQSFLDKDSSNTITIDKPLNAITLPLISLFIAIIIVLLGSGANATITEIPGGVVLSAANVPNGISANFGSQNRVNVLVSIPRSQKAAISSDSFSAVVDVANRSDGGFDLPISITSKIADVKILKVEPATTYVTLEPVIKKTVSVVVKYDGKAGNELIPDDPILNPDKVEITGPKSVVSNLTQAVIPVKLNGETQNLTFNASPIVEDASGETIAGVTVNPAQVNVTVPLVKAGKVKTVGIKPVVNGVAGSGYWVKSVTTNPSTVTVTGNVEQLSALDSIPTDAIAISGKTADFQQKVTLAFPSGISSADTITSVQATIQFDKLQSSKTITPQIITNGLSSSLKVTNLSTLKVNVVVSGSVDLLQNVDSQTQLTLDLSAYKTAGTYSINILNTDIQVPSGITVVSFLPSAIDVTLDNK